MRCIMTRKFRPVVPALLLVWLVGAALVAQEPKLPELTPEEQKLAAEALKLNEEAGQMYQQGKAAQAVAKLRQSLEIYQRLYPVLKYPDGHRDLAASLNNLGFMLQAAG